MEESSVLVEIEPSPDTTNDELDILTRQLRSEILLTAVDSVEAPISGSAPAGSKSADPFTIGALLIAWSASGSVFPALVGVLKTWIDRNSEHKLAVTCKGGRKVTISGHSTADELALLAQLCQDSPASEKQGA